MKFKVGERVKLKPDQGVYGLSNPNIISADEIYVVHSEPEEGLIIFEGKPSQVFYSSCFYSYNDGSDKVDNKEFIKVMREHKRLLEI